MTTEQPESYTPEWSGQPLREGEHDVAVMFRVTGASKADARRVVVRIITRDQLENTIVPMYVPGDGLDPDNLTGMDLGE